MYYFMTFSGPVMIHIIIAYYDSSPNPDGRGFVSYKSPKYKTHPFTFNYNETNADAKNYLR